MLKQVDYDESVCWLIEFENCWMKRNPTIKRPNRIKRANSECDSLLQFSPLITSTPPNLRSKSSGQKITGHWQLLLNLGLKYSDFPCIMLSKDK